MCLSCARSSPRRTLSFQALSRIDQWERKRFARLIKENEIVIINLINERESHEGNSSCYFETDKFIVPIHFSAKAFLHNLRAWSWVEQRSVANSFERLRLQKANSSFKTLSDDLTFLPRNDKKIFVCMNQWVDSKTCPACRELHARQNE